MKRKMLIGRVLLYLTLGLLPMMSARAQSPYFQAVTNLSPVGYWPMHETTPPAVQGCIETNYGTLGVLGTGFYFNSTKFNCEWASPTDAEGRGLCVVFSPDQRQHVRGGFGAGESRTLVVNRCYSPPRDISRRIVADLYTVLEKNEQVAGRFEIHGIAAP